jgi:hypothetical protein
MLSHYPLLLRRKMLNDFASAARGSPHQRNLRLCEPTERWESAPKRRRFERLVPTRKTFILHELAAKFGVRNLGIRQLDCQNVAEQLLYFSNVHSRRLPLRGFPKCASAKYVIRMRQWYELR